MHQTNVRSNDEVTLETETEGTEKMKRGYVFLHSGKHVRTQSLGGWESRKRTNVGSLKVLFWGKKCSAWKYSNSSVS